MKLLIAEDDLTSRKILESIAQKWGYETILAEDGEAAWKILQQNNPPELLLLDWEMPNLSGLELCQRIRAEEKNDPAFIILLSSRKSTEDIVAGLEAGSNEYIAKPFENAELKARLRVGQRMLELQANRRLAENQKSRLQRELQQTRKMEALGQITGAMAHDFNNILGITMGYTSMAIDRFGDDIPEKMKEYLSTALKSSERAKLLVAKMLMFSHDDDQQVEPMNIAEEVQASLEGLKYNCSDLIEMTLNIEDDLPEILCDPEKIQMVLRILCENAEEAMDGVGTISLELGWCRNIDAECSDCLRILEGDWIELSVTDKGCGINSETLAHLFEPFYTTKEMGKGMGMAMLHGILSRNNGHCLIETKVGVGTKVRLLFPVVAQ